jgi:hypothetical protein
MKSMKYPSVAVCLLLGFVFVMTVQSVSQAKRALPPATSLVQEQNPPKIINARIKGSKVIILGENFTPGTVVYVNGQAVKTNVDSDSPSSILVAKKVNKVAQMGEEVSLEVKTSNGQTSDPFAFFLGRIILIDDNLKTINVAVGENVMLLLNKEPYEWTPSVQDSSIFQKVQDPPLMKGAQGIFQAKRIGSTQLSAIGEIPCNSAERPCLPSSALQFTVDIVVQ